MTTETRKRGTAKTALWITLGILLLVLLGIGIMFLLHILRVTSSPSIEILAPSEGQSAPAFSPIVVQATALQRRTPISRLDFYADGILSGSISGGADSLVGSWNWTPSSGGIHDLAFVATNTKGVINLVRRTIEITDIADTDNDGIPDTTDACPEEYGYPASSGCLDETDSDGDGLTGDADACPEEYGSSVDGGCPPDARPDADGDGILDSVDRCPELSGLVEFAGCPFDAWFADRDGDSIPDTLDRCLDLAGSPDSYGCPEVATGDGDGDGIADAADACPEEPGGEGTTGCPLAGTEDSDGDGVIDSADACPDEAGVASADGCRPEDWTADADLDFIPDLFDLSPTLPGLFDRLGIPLPEDEDADGSTVAQDMCPDLVGSPADGGCPRLTLPEDSYRLQNAFRLFPESPADFSMDSDGTAKGPLEEAWPNDEDRDGVDDSRDDICPGLDGEPDLYGCPPHDDPDRDGIRGTADRCPEEPGLYWGEYTDTYPFGCPLSPPGRVTLELQVTAVRTPDEMQVVYCYTDPTPRGSDKWLIRIPPAGRNYSTSLVSGYGYYLGLREFSVGTLMGNTLENEPIQLYISCWGQPEGISQPAVFLGEIYREVRVEDWDGQIRYAAGLGNDTMLELFFRICRNRCP